MARAGRRDRGLLSQPDSTGKSVWYVRLYHEERARQFGSFSNKTKAREFYEKTKLEQQEGRFFPERYQQAGYDLVETGIDRHLLTITTRKPKSQAEERYFGAWWKRYFQGRRLNTVTVPALGAARQTLLRTAIAEGQEGVPERFITPH